MTSTFDAGPPDHWFTPPGTLRISAAALALTKRFHAEASQAAPEEDWVVSFDWADSRRWREKGTNTWRDVGAGLDLTAYERWKVADRHIQRLEGLDVAVKVPAPVWEKSAERLIDADPAAFSGLVLR